MKINKKKKTNDELTSDELMFLDEYDDQYQQIKDSLDITNSTDSETTDIVGFRVINTNNAYPDKNDHKYTK